MHGDTPSKPGAVVRAMSGDAKGRLFFLLARINELQALQERNRPVTIHWQATEIEFAEICEDLVTNTAPSELWKVLTLLAMEAATEFGVDLEDGSYDEEE